MNRIPAAFDGYPTAAASAFVDDADELLAAATTDLHLDTARTLGRLSSVFGDRLAPDHPDHPLISHLARDLVSAGFTIRNRLLHERTGGVSLTAGDRGSGGGVVVTWTTHAALACDPRRRDLHADTELLVNFALDDVLCALGWRSEPVGPTGAHVVTGRMEPFDSPEGRRG